MVNQYTWHYHKIVHDLLNNQRRDDFVLFTLSGTAGSQRWSCQFAGKHSSTFWRLTNSFWYLSSGAILPVLLNSALQWVTSITNNKIPASMLTNPVKQTLSKCWESREISATFTSTPTAANFFFFKRMKDRYTIPLIIWNGNFRPGGEW